MLRRRAFLAGAITLLGVSPRSADAAQIEITAASIERSEDAYVLQADFEFELNSRLEEALHSGLTLHFVVEVEVSRGRWYWFDDRVASTKLQQRLWFNALTRQYRLATGGFSQSFSSLAEAERMLQHVRGLQIADRRELDRGTRYDVHLRMRLDTSQLPRLFQVTAFSQREWALASEWRRLRFTA